MQYTIHNEYLRVTVDSRGAELINVVKDGKERLWQNPTGEWGGHAPVLFPVCGHCGMTVDGVSYPIQMHGVARKAEFALAAQTDDSLRFVLSSDENTKLVYPYDFVFEVTYRLSGATLAVEFTVKNPANVPLYFACGSHESYALDGNVDEYQIEFDEQTKLTHYPHNGGAMLTGEAVDFGTRKVFPLPRDLLLDGVTLIFKDVACKKLRLTHRDGTPLAELTYEGFDNLLLWHAVDAKYICIEPWTNLPDLAGVPDPEFSTKCGVMKVDGGATKTLVHTIKYY